MAPPTTTPPIGWLPDITVQADEPASSKPSAYDHVTCITCGPLTACTEQLVMKKNLFQTKEQGCASCSFFWKASSQVPDFDKFDSVSTWLGNGGVFVLCLGKSGIVSVDEAGEVVVILASNTEKSWSPFPWLPSVFKSPFTRSPLRDTYLVSSWIDECQANHSNCRQAMDPILPLRVINVGSETTQPFLKITHGERGRYVALSHRWGDLNGMTITKRECVEQFAREIPFTSLPLTFRHAIEVTRSLDISYLWIDSICIVQDDLQDWEIQAAKMGDIYENAYATLFAERAGNCNSGLFQTELDKKIAAERVQEIEYRNPQTNEQYWVLMSVGFPYYPNTLRGAFCLADEPVSYLQNRGWIMQEEILSHRKICFSKTELHWQCKTISQCECGLESMVDFSETDLTKNLLLKDRIDGSTTRGLSSSNITTITTRNNVPDINKSWKNLIKIYTRHILTNEQDRLSALAGVASKLNRSHQTYMAGIWLQDAADQLLWRGWNTTGRPCRRRETYCAPSFSWASIEGRIVFCSLFSNNKTVIWKVLHGSCKPSGENPMGPVSAGLLRIRSSVIAVLVDECEAPSKIDVGDESKISLHVREGKTYYLELRPMSRSNGLKNTIVTLDTEDDWKHFSGKKSEQYLYVVAHIGTETMAGLSDVSEERLSIMGLLVRESATGEGYWERVCLCALDGWWRDWKWVAGEREIMLV